MTFTDPPQAATKTGERRAAIGSLHSAAVADRFDGAGGLALVGHCYGNAHVSVSIPVPTWRKTSEDVREKWVLPAIEWVLLSGLRDERKST